MFDITNLIVLYNNSQLFCDITKPILWYQQIKVKTCQNKGFIVKQRPVSLWVPQWFILGPLLFLIYIHDIVEDIHSSIRLFAGDTSLYIIVDDPTVSVIILNSDLHKIQKWASEWLLSHIQSC